MYVYMINYVYDENNGKLIETDFNVRAEQNDCDLFENDTTVFFNEPVLNSFLIEIYLMKRNDFLARTIARSTTSSFILAKNN